MSVNMKISAQSGVVNVDPISYWCKLRGTTCPTTLRVGLDYMRNPFRIFPDGEKEAHLVLVETKYGVQEPALALFHVKKGDDNFVMVKVDPTEAKDIVGIDVNYQVHQNWIEVQAGEIRFTSDYGVPAANGEKVMFVDETSILLFIAGHIRIKELRARAKKIQEQNSLARELAMTKLVLAASVRDVIALKAEKASLEGRIARFAAQVAPAQ